MRVDGWSHKVCRVIPFGFGARRRHCTYTGFSLDRLSESIAWSSRTFSLPRISLFHCNEHNSSLKDKTLHPTWRLNSFYGTQQDFSRSKVPKLRGDRGWDAAGAAADATFGTPHHFGGSKKERSRTLSRRWIADRSEEDGERISRRAERE